VLPVNVVNKKPSSRWDSRSYWLSVTYKVIRNRQFSCHLKGDMPLSIVISSSISLTVSEIWPVFR